jgi:hypothetical protein
VYILEVSEDNLSIAMQSQYNILHVFVYYKQLCEVSRARLSTRNLTENGWNVGMQMMTLLAFTLLRNMSYSDCFLRRVCPSVYT